MEGCPARMGAALQAALVGRECALSADEARVLALRLLNLIAEGIIVASEASSSCSALDGPTAYNMGPSISIEDEER